MKTLYISNYKELSGYSRAAQEHILALDIAGVPVVPKHISFGQPWNEIPTRITELEKLQSYDCQNAIQHTLPHLFAYDGRYKNIGFFATETSNFSSSAWANHCNLLDEIWVINSQSRESCLNSGVTVPIKVVPHPIDIGKCSSKFEPINLPTENDFVFYTIAEFSRRKNLKALLMAFHLEFDLNDSAQLVIKSNIPGKDPNESKQILMGFMEEIINGMKIKSRHLYKKVILITNKLSEDQIMGMHSLGNCFVCTSYGEAWCIPAFEAWASGKGVIAPNTGAFADCMTNENAWLVPTHTEPVFGMLNTFADLYTSDETWENIDIDALRAAMREAYENKTLLKEKQIKAIHAANNYSRQEVGHLMKTLLVG